MFQFPIRNIEHFIAQTRHQLHITTKNEKPHRVEAVAGPGWLVADQLLVTKWVTSNSARLQWKTPNMFNMMQRWSSHYKTLLKKWGRTKHHCMFFLYKNNRKKLITSTKIGFARWGFGQMYWRRKCNVEGRRGVQCAWWAWLGRRQREKWAWGEFAWRRLLRATPRRLLQRGRVFHLMNTMLMMMRHSWCH